MVSRRALATAAAAATLTLPETGAGAVEVRAVDFVDYPRVRLTVVTSRPSSIVPRVAEHAGRVAGVGAQNLGDGTSIVLAIDRSGSMAGRPLAAAVTAARLFVAGKAPTDRIAVIAFGSEATQLSSFSSNAADAHQALAGLTHDTRAGTALFDAVRLSATALGREPDGGRVILLLTDGRNRAGGSSLPEATAAVRDAGAAVYPIGIVGVGLSRAPLRELAATSGGRYTFAATSNLPLAYAAIADELRRTWRLEYVTATRPGERLRLSVWVPSLGSDLATVPAPGNGRAPGAATAAFGSPWADVLLAIAVAGLVFGAYAAFAAWRRAVWLRRRLRRPEGASDEPAVRRSLRERVQGSFAGLLTTTERVGEHFGPWRAFERLLARAQVPLRAVELLYTMLGSGFGLALLVALLAAPAALILLALVAGAAIPLGVVWMRGRRRRRAFDDQLPDLLLTLASALKAGQSFRQGIQTIVDEGTEPAVSEFRLVLGEARLGRPLEEALAEMAERIGSKDFSFVVSAVTIQRQVGGSLAGIFDLVAEAVRERQQFARRIKGLTATGRMSAYVLVALPFGLAAVLTAMNPEYMSPLYEEPLGRAMVFGGLMMMSIGALLLRKIVAFKG